MIQRISQSLFSKNTLKWIVILSLSIMTYFLCSKNDFAYEACALVAVFVATILGLILQPMPGEQVVFLSLAVVGLLKILPIEKVLSGYSEPIVWLVLAAVFLSRGMIKTGLGKRLSLHMIRMLGKSSLGIGYAFVFTDFFLGSVIPSNGARAGGVIFPIAKSLSETFQSYPGPTSGRLGKYIMTLIYQGDVIVCSAFLTGQVSNILIAKFVKELTGLNLSYGQWLLAAIVPALLSLIAIPYVVYKIIPPEVKTTPTAPALAKEELDRVGPMTTPEKIMLGVFLLVAILWSTVPLHGIHYSLVALLGISILLLTNVLTFQDLVSEKVAWSVFIWYGGLIMLASGLQEFGITKSFAQSVAAYTMPFHWITAVSIICAVYFFSSYVFASITAHVTAMFIPFLTVLLTTQAPPWLVVLLLAFFSNLSAGLTHYGTTPGPIYFASGYVSQGEWWRVGMIAAIVNLFIWLVVGIGWWQLIGLNVIP